MWLGSIYSQSRIRARRVASALQRAAQPTVAALVELCGLAAIVAAGWYIGRPLGLLALGLVLLGWPVLRRVGRGPA